MKAIIMAGGRGTRMKLTEEKPLIKLQNKELILHALETLKKSSEVESIIAVTSHYTPSTENFLENLKIPYLRAPGRGYVDDLRWAISHLKLDCPVIVCSSDLVFLDSSVVDEIIHIYSQINFPALTVCILENCNPVPIGLNIVDGRLMDREQEEITVIVENDRLVNVNTVEDLKKVEKLMRNENEWSGF